LRDRLEAGILALPALAVNGAWDGDKPVPRVANTTNIWSTNWKARRWSSPGPEGRFCLRRLGLPLRATEPSHVLMAMGFEQDRARASLRFSLLKTVTEADVDYVLKVVPEAVEHLRALSPVAAGTWGKVSPAI